MKNELYDLGGPALREMLGLPETGSAFMALFTSHGAVREFQGADFPRRRPDVTSTRADLPTPKPFEMGLLELPPMRLDWREDEL